jgi:hypothetical protein
MASFDHKADNIHKKDNNLIWPGLFVVCWYSGKRFLQCITISVLRWRKNVAPPPLFGQGVCGYGDGTRDLNKKTNKKIARSPGFSRFTRFQRESEYNPLQPFGHGIFMPFGWLIIPVP